MDDSQLSKLLAKLARIARRVLSEISPSVETAAAKVAGELRAAAFRVATEPLRERLYSRLPETKDADLARAVGRNRSDISKWFSGRSVPRSDTYVTSLLYLGFGIPGYNSGQKRAAFDVAAATIQSINRAAFSGESDTLQPWQCACVYYFLQHANYLETFLDEGSEIINTDEWSQAVKRITRTVAKDFPSVRITAERVVHAIEVWFHPFVAFYSAIEYSDWPLFAETGDEAIE